MSTRKLILDVDTGIDDALALAYLATFSHSHVELLGVIGTYGNVAADTAVRNTRHVLGLLGRSDVPVMRGATHPSWAAAFIPDAGCAQFHGTDGLGGFGPGRAARMDELDGKVDSSAGSDGNVDSDGSDVQDSLVSVPAYLPVRPPADTPDDCSDSTKADGPTISSLISVGGYASHDPHANPAGGALALSFVTCDDAACGPANDGSADASAGDSTDISEGVRFIIDTVREYGTDVTVVATGPLTDIDTALRVAPDIAGKLRLVMMGGTLTQEGNCWDLTAETNIIQDPEAADRVFHSGADITMVGLDVTHQCLLGRSATRRWREIADMLERGETGPAPVLADSSSDAPSAPSAVSAVSVASEPAPAPSPAASHHPFSPQALRFLADIADFSIAANLKTDARLFSAGMPLHDPLAAAVAVDPTLVSCLDLPMKVETQTGDFHGTRGRTIGDPEGLIDPHAPRVHVALHVDAARFINEFTDRIAGARH